MQINPGNLPQLAQMLTQERKRQKLSRAQAAAVCNVSPSFIRDAETHPERCSLGKLVMLINGLGLTMVITDQSIQHIKALTGQAIADGKMARVIQDRPKNFKEFGRVTILDPDKLKP